jgi:hypothetical protein
VVVLLQLLLWLLTSCQVFYTKTDEPGVEHLVELPTFYIGLGLLVLVEEIANLLGKVQDGSFQGLVSSKTLFVMVFRLS